MRGWVALFPNPTSRSTSQARMKSDLPSDMRVTEIAAYNDLFELAHRENTLRGRFSNRVTDPLRESLDHWPGIDHGADDRLSGERKARTDKRRSAVQVETFKPDRAASTQHLDALAGGTPGKTFAGRRTAEADEFPANIGRIGGETDARLDGRIGTIEKDCFLRKVLADSVGTDIDDGAQRAQTVRAAVEFRSTWRRKHRPRTGSEVARYLQPIAASDAPRWMQEIDVGCTVRLGMKGALDDERANVSTAHQTRFSNLRFEPQLKFCVPVAWPDIGYPTSHLPSTRQAQHTLT